MFANIFLYTVQDCPMFYEVKKLNIEFIIRSAACHPKWNAMYWWVISMKLKVCFSQGMYNI
jgi:hypothetical protein